MGIFDTLFVTLAGHELTWGPRGETPGSSGVLGNTLRSDEHKLWGYLIRDTGKTQIDVGSKGRSPRSLGDLYIKLSSEEHILYLICDTGRVANWRGVQGAEPPEAQGFWAIHYDQMSIFWIPYLWHWQDTNWCWVQGAEPPKAQGFLYIKLSSDEHNLIPYLWHLAGHELVWGPGGGAPGSSGVLGNKLRSDEHIFIPYLWHWQDTNWCWVPEAQSYANGYAIDIVWIQQHACYSSCVLTKFRAQYDVVTCFIDVAWNLSWDTV